MAAYPTTGEVELRLQPILRILFHGVREVADRG
jgi:hypothetical protein